MNNCQMTRIPKRGQRLWYIILTEVKSRSITEVIDLLESKGYQPKLKYRESEDGLELFAVLRDDITDDVNARSEDTMDETASLFELFPGEEDALGFSFMPVNQVRPVVGAVNC